MNPMRVLMIRAVLGVGGFLALLLVAIVVNKALRQIGETLDRRRRAALEAAVRGYLDSATRRPLRECVPVTASRRDRRLLEAILLDAARDPKNARLERITAAFEERGSVRQAIAALRSARWWKRADAAERLGQMRSRESIEPLVALLGDAVPEVRLRAAEALGGIRARASIRPIVGALADPSRWSAIRIAEILIQIGDEAVEEILQACDGLPLAARVTALDILGRIRSPKAAALLKRCLVDPSPDIRARAAHGLGLLGDARVCEELVRAMADPEWPVRAMAAKSLGLLLDPQAIPPLARGLQDRQWWVRHNSGEALRRLGPGGLEALTDALVSSDPYARHMAVEQLEEGQVIDRYVADLTAGDPARHAAAMRFIDKITAAAHVDDRTRQAAASTQAGVRQALSSILKPPPKGVR